MLPQRSKILGQLPDEDRDTIPTYRDTNRLMRVLGITACQSALEYKLYKCIIHSKHRKIRRSGNIDKILVLIDIPE